MAVSWEPALQPPARTDMEVGDAPGDPGLGPVGVLMPQPLLRILQAHPVQLGWGERLERRFPGGEGRGQIDEPSVYSCDRSDLSGMQERQLEDDVAAPRLAGNQRPVHAETDHDGAKILHQRSEVVTDLGSVRPAVTPLVNGYHPMTRPRQAAPHSLPDVGVGSETMDEKHLAPCALIGLRSPLDDVEVGPVTGPHRVARAHRIHWPSRLGAAEQTADGAGIDGGRQTADGRRQPESCRLV